MSMSHRHLLLPIVTLVALVLVSCGSSSSSSGKNATSVTASTFGAKEPSFKPLCTVPASKQLKVALIIAQGGLGDQSYNDLAYSGFQRAKADFPIVGRVIQSADIVSQGQAIVQQTSQANFDLVIDLEFSTYDAVKATAPKYPQTQWMTPNFDSLATNDTGYLFSEQDGSYLAGALATMVSQDSSVPGITPSKAIGVIGGVKAVGIDKFIAGYVQGARDTDPNMKVLVNYSNGFGDPAKGKELADAMFAQGANVVYQVAGGTGTGVIQAAQAAKKYAIGVDSDQDAIAPGHVLTSMIKRTDFAVYDSINRLACGKLKGGETVNLGLNEGGVGLSPMKFTRNQIPSKYLDKVADLQQKIINGQIKVWNTITQGNPPWFPA
jgi:basic membrane protein A and related proteins